MLSHYKRGDVYYVQGTHNGQQIARASLDTTNKTVALERIHQLEKELDNPQALSGWKDLTELFFTSHAELKPLTLKKYRFVAQRFGAHLERHALTTLGEITPATISKYITERSKDTHPTNGNSVGAEGMKSDLRCLRAFLNFAVEQDYLKANPIRKKQLNSGVSDSEPYTPDEIQTMLRYARKRCDQRGAPINLTPILLTFMRTGLRISDVIKFPKSAVNFTEDQIIIKTQKRLKVVYIPLTADLKQALLEHLQTLNPQQQVSPWLFSTRSGKPIRNLDAYLHRFWAQTGISNAHAHRFRDTFAVELLQHGASLYDVAKVLGISHAVAERHYTPYVKSLQDRTRSLMHALPNLSASGTAAAHKTLLQNLQNADKIDR